MTGGAGSAHREMAGMVYDVKVYQKDCGELIVAEVDVEDSADPDMIRLVVYCHRPGT